MHKHAHRQLSGGLSRCNRIHFVTRLVNDLKLDFMHAFILIYSLLFFHFGRKNSENNQDLLHSPIKLLNRTKRRGIYSFSFD